MAAGTAAAATIPPAVCSHARRVNVAPVDFVLMWASRFAMNTLKPPSAPRAPRSAFFGDLGDLGDLGGLRHSAVVFRA
jgi:hypothetical protein